MLVDTQYLPNTKKLIASYVDKSGEIKIRHYSMEHPMKYVSCDATDIDKHPKFKSWDGKCVKQIEVNYPDRYSIYEFLDQLPEEEKEELFQYNEPKMYFVDIETEIDFTTGAYSQPEDANGRIISISVVYDDKIILMGLEEMSNEMQSRIINNTNKYFEKYGTEYKLKYLKYDDEFSMLWNFFNKMVPKMPLITGWNFLNYDWLYLVNRSRKVTKIVNGDVIIIDPRVSSVTKRLNKIWSTEFEIPAHRMIFDYMQLYEITDTSVKVKESSSLDFVSSKLVGVDKIKYNGSLQNLYETDFETFMYYNAVDSILVQRIHLARNYVSIIFAISSLSRIRVVDVVSQMNNALGSLAITEGVLRNRFREMENIVLFKDENAIRDDGEGIAGGWVKDPIVGMNKWVSVYDFMSLYPITQLEFFIAPETFVGVKPEEEEEYCFRDNQRIKIDKSKHVVCANGVVFEKRYSPTLKMLDDVFKERKKNKNIMMDTKKELKKVLDEIKKLEEELNEI